MELNVASQNDKENIMNHIVSDYVIRLKNSATARRKEVVFPNTKLVRAMNSVLVAQKFLRGVREEEVEGRKVLVGDIAYQNSDPVISGVEIFSKPSLRVYGGVKDKKLRGVGVGVTVVSTNKGIMTGRDAYEKKLGGELLFRIW